MWDSVTKRSIIERIQQVWSKSSDNDKALADVLFRQFLEVITMGEGDERERTEKALEKDLERFEKGGGSKGLDA